MKMNKILVLMVVMVFGLTVVAMAETTVDTSWGFYGGDLSIDFQSGDDAQVGFGTGGNQAFGNFFAKDYDNNSYGYNVDTTRSKISSDFENGGYINYSMNRQDSKVSMYGNAGQYTSTYISSNDGSGSFATNVSSNFAGMKTCNYGYQANNQYSVSGSNYYMDHTVYAGPGSLAGFEAYGNGSTTVTLMSDEMSGGGWRMGEGCGCYTNASANGTGSGEFALYAGATDYLRGNNWDANGGSYSAVLNFSDGFNYNNINMVGNGVGEAPEPE